VSANLPPVPLKVAATIYPEERHYLDETLAPPIRTSTPLVEFVSEAGHRDRENIHGHAAAFLFAIEWPEPLEQRFDASRMANDYAGIYQESSRTAAPGR
jgi:hypothetical protein